MHGFQGTLSDNERNADAPAPLVCVLQRWGK